ncbi:MAG: hypothetical protein WA240_03945 [Nitrospirota bacterium]
MGISLRLQILNSYMTSHKVVKQMCLWLFSLARQNKSACPDFHISLEASFGMGVDQTI